MLNLCALITTGLKLSLLHQIPSRPPCEQVWGQGIGRSQDPHQSRPVYFQNQSCSFNDRRKLYGVPTCHDDIKNTGAGRRRSRGGLGPARFHHPYEEVICSPSYTHSHTHTYSHTILSKLYSHVPPCIANTAVTMVITTDGMAEE